MKKMKKQWTDYKAMESCFGEDMMKTSMLKMKKAVVKCTGMDMPELDLPMYKSPHRVVHALLESAEDLEQMKMIRSSNNSAKVNNPATNLNQFNLFLDKLNNSHKTTCSKKCLKENWRSLELTITKCPHSET